MTGRRPANTIERSMRTIDGVVTAEKSGLLTVKTSEGTSMSVTSKASERHGHAIPKVGQEGTLILNENNNVIDVHLKGGRGRTWVRDEKVSVRGQDEAGDQTPDPRGRQDVSLVRQDIKTGGIEEGALVTAELNEAGAVIDLHRAKK